MGRSVDVKFTVTVTNKMAGLTEKDGRDTLLVALLLSGEDLLATGEGVAVPGPCASGDSQSRI